MWKTSLQISICGAESGNALGAAGFWATMAGPADVQRVAPAERWDMDAVYSPDILPGKMSINVRCARRDRSFSSRHPAEHMCPDQAAQGTQHGPKDTLMSRTFAGLLACQGSTVVPIWCCQVWRLLRGRRHV